MLSVDFEDGEKLAGLHFDAKFSAASPGGRVRRVVDCKEGGGTINE